jgi:hypothetical protein
MSEQVPESFVARSHIRALVRDEIKRFVDDILSEAIGESIGRTVREAEQKIIARIEEAAFAYKGQFQDAMRYQRGNFVSMGGGLWHANRDTTARPGADDTWTLAVKSGRDGRDGKDGVGAPALDPPPARMAHTVRRNQRS